MKRKELETLSKDELIDLVLQLQDEKPIGWDTLRELVWERDGGMCRVCGLDMRKMKAWYHCGHIIDKMKGGTDELDNLVVMCRYCNEIKPLHETKDEYRQWLKSGYWLTSNFSSLKEQLETQVERIKQKHPDVDFDIDYNKLLRDGQVNHLQRVTGKPSNPKDGWQDDFHQGWKTHE